MDQQTIRMLKELTEFPGVPGYEAEGRKVVRKYLPKGVTVSTDALGSIICEKRGAAAGPRIMIPGHMDEIGFMVKVVTEKGFIKFQPLGGWWDQRQRDSSSARRLHRLDHRCRLRPDFPRRLVGTRPGGRSNDIELGR